jgi:hypothetical protein
MSPNILPDISADNRAMTRLNSSENQLLSKEGGRALANMLKANTILKELDVSGSGKGMSSSQKDAPGFATEISEGLACNKALIKLDISRNCIGAAQEGELQRICLASGIELAQ